MPRVLLVDDHACFREALAFMLEREPDMAVVGQAGSLAEARQLLEEVGPVIDVAIVDLNLPDGNGVELVSELQTVCRQGSVLILAATLDNRQHAWAVEAGAAGVLRKSASIAQIITAVRRVHAGELLLAPDETVAMFRGASQDRAARQVLARLTQREQEVLQVLAEGHSDNEIARRLQISVETVRKHMANILAKLNVDSRLKALVFAVRYGCVAIN